MRKGYIDSSCLISTFLILLAREIASISTCCWERIQVCICCSYNPCKLVDSFLHSFVHSFMHLTMNELTCSRVMKAMHENGVPVPKPVLLCEDERCGLQKKENDFIVMVLDGISNRFLSHIFSVIGTPFYIMEYVRGRIFKDPSLPGMTNEVRKVCFVIVLLANLNIKELVWFDFLRDGRNHSICNLKEIYQEMNKTLAKIHQVDIIKAGLEDFGKHGKSDSSLSCRFLSFKAQ